MKKQYKTSNSFLKNVNLLYIDENIKHLKLYQEYFNSLFSNIYCVHDLKDAQKYLTNENIQIIIIDNKSAENDNFNLIKKIKKSDENIITILLSQEFKQEEQLKASSIQMTAYLIKSLQNNYLLELLNNIIKKHIKKIKLKNEVLKIKQHNKLLNDSTIVSKTNKTGIITYANENFCKASGYSKEELIGKNHNIVKHPDNPSELFKELWQTIRFEKKEWHGILKNLTKKGKSYYVKSTIKPIFDINGEIVEYIAVRNDVSSIMSDTTQLINKIDNAELSLLVLIQIEEFSMLDKFYNLSTVDQIEKVFGYELLSYLPTEYLFENVFNLGEGRYALLTDFYTMEKSISNIDEYFKKFTQNVNKSVLTIDEIEYDLNIVLSYSFGKYMLYEDAKYGLEKALEDKSRISYSNDSSIVEYNEARKNLEIMEMVKTALENYNIVSYFQPIINNKTKEIEKYESLVRLINEKGEILSPYFFLDVSKQGTYYNKITHRVLENSFKMLKHISTKISINISSLDIEKENTRNRIFELLDEYHEYTNKIIFELLEDENVKNFKVIEDFINKVKPLGVQIAIDDFGAGYSNFERLLKFQPDILKIDGSLIKDIVNDKYSRNVVETIVSFAKKQEIETIAEFVENEEIFNVLNEIGIDYSQGYFFGQPQSMTIIKEED